MTSDGEEVLACTAAGATVEYQKAHGVGFHLARFHLSSGHGTLVKPVFANPEATMERDIFEPRWRKATDSSWSLSLHPNLAAHLNEPVTIPSELSWIGEERWADEAEIVMVSALNKAIALVQQKASVAHLMPEVVAALRPIAKSPVWARQSEWVTNLRDITMSMVSSGELEGNFATPWLYFAVAIRAIEQGESDQISAIRMQR